MTYIKYRVIWQNWLSFYLFTDIVNCTHFEPFFSSFFMCLAHFEEYKWKNWWRKFYLLFRHFSFVLFNRIFIRLEIILNWDICISFFFWCVSLSISGWSIENPFSIEICNKKFLRSSSHLRSFLCEENCH